MGQEKTTRRLARRAGLPSAADEACGRSPRTRNLEVLAPLRSAVVARRGDHQRPARRGYGGVGGYGGGYGVYVEPLATLAVADTDIDDFDRFGNDVEFDDETSVRGRLGLKVGTTFGGGESLTVEPAVTASVWHEFGGDNGATITAGGATFDLSDSMDETWGEVSGMVTLYAQGSGISAFGKVDVLLGEDIEGLTGRGGVRFAW